MAERHLITSEYPPQHGGVSDYSHLIANGLATAGERVHVWCRSFEGARPQETGLTVHQELGNVTPADLMKVGRMLDGFSSPRRLLVQWVPHGYGYKSMNLFFCLWLLKRARQKRDEIEIMVHEPFLSFGEGSKKQDAAAAVHRLMTTILLKAASRVWVSIPGWETCLRPFAFGGVKSFVWLPVPSNIPVVDDTEGIAKVRTRYAPNGEFLVGHFGAYDIYMLKLMLELLPSLLEKHGNVAVLLLGKGSEALRFELIAKHPDLGRRVYASGALTAKDVSRHISACDLMLQPYQDGVSSRRGSLMAALAHGCPVVTTNGAATESLWAESGAVCLTEVGSVSSMVEATGRLLSDAFERRRLSVAARALYEERFDARRTILALLERDGVSLAS